MLIWPEGSLSPEEYERLKYPSCDGVPVEDRKHVQNQAILSESLEPYLAQQGIPAFVATNNFIYYQREAPRKNVGPDFYVVLHVEEDPERDCWRMWNEGNRAPDVIVEFLSKTTEAKDRGKNFLIYRDILKVANYFLCDNRNYRLEGFRREGSVYVSLQPDKNGRLACDVLGLELGFHEGFLRWFLPGGDLVPTGREQAVLEWSRAEQEARRAQQEARRAEQEAQRADEEARLRRDAEERLQSLQDELRRLRGEA